MCEGDEEVEETPQPDPEQQPAPTYDENTGEFTQDFNGEEEPSEFPIVPVLGAGGALLLIAALA